MEAHHSGHALEHERFRDSGDFLTGSVTRCLGRNQCEHRGILIGLVAGNLKQTVPVIDVLAEMRDAAPPRPGRDIDEMHRDGL